MFERGTNKKSIRSRLLLYNTHEEEALNTNRTIKKKKQKNMLHTF